VADNSLSTALNLLEACRPLLSPTTDPQLLAEHGALYASVSYDIGTVDTLERGLRQLTSTSKQLLDVKQPLLAAELLNDEASIWLKLGDPVRAHYLLSRSREVFGKVVQSHPGAGRELAQTEHMLARLVLNATARPGRERDALQLGVEHGLSALDSYHSLGDRLQVARVQETLGRLETRLEHVERAAKFLNQARSTQLELRDALGLARSTAALSDVLAQIGEYEQALGQLNESVTLNVHKGSIAGLEFNAQALNQLMPSLPAASMAQASALENRLTRLLATALPEE
jgi:tetratricopeptide (TPR) repeat protein